MARQWIGVILILTACASPPVVKPPLIPPEKCPETRPLPPDPSKESPPQELPKGDWLEPLEAKEPAPAAGILVSEERGWRDAVYKIRYHELRGLYDSDRDLWASHREYYEKTLQNKDETIRELTPTFIERHAATIGMVVGFLTGAALTASIVLAFYPRQGQEL